MFTAGAAGNSDICLIGFFPSVLRDSVPTKTLQGILGNVNRKWKQM